MSGGQVATVEVLSDGSVPVEFAQHRDDGATQVLSNQRSGETGEAAAGRLAAAADVTVGSTLADDQYTQVSTNLGQ